MQMPHFSQTLATELRDHRSFAFLTDQLTRILVAEHFAYVHTDPKDHFPFKIQIQIILIVLLFKVIFSFLLFKIGLFIRIIFEV